MRDEIFDRNYQAGRADLNAGIDRAVQRIGGTVAKSFEVLHRIQWSAPWTSNSKNPQCG
jgi:hypothetical protein